MANAPTDVTPHVEADRAFTRLFRASPAPFLILLPDPPRFTIAEVNDAFLAATARTRDALVGSSVFEAFPDDPGDASAAGAGTLRASLERVLATRRPDALPRFRYDIARPDGTFEERWWSAVVSAVLDDRGEIEFLIHNANDVTASHRAEVALRDSEARYHALFATSPVPFMVLAPNRPDFTITAANAAYLVATMTTREGLIGRRLFDVFTDDPDRRGDLGSTALAQSLDRVLATRQPDAMERTRYDIVTPGGGFEPHWWLAINAPVLDSAGRVTAILHQVTRVTELHLAEEAQRTYERAIRESELRLKTLVAGVPTLVWRAAADGRWTWASPQWTAYTGQAEAASRGTGWLDAVHPDDRDGALLAWGQAAEDGEFQTDHRIRHAAEDRHAWFHTRALPVRDAAGGIVEWLGTSTDVDGMRQLQERQRILVGELQHRTRNLLSVVSGIASRTLAAPGTPDELERRLDRRLSALGRVQGLLSTGPSPTITLGTLLRLELDAHGIDAATDASIRMEGPDVALPAAAVQLLAMALHELATNALKHGVLKTGGELSIRWTVERRRLVLVWRERGLPLVESDLPRGFGRELIEVDLPYELDARTRLAFDADGVTCRIEVLLQPAVRQARATDPAPRSTRAAP